MKELLISLFGMAVTGLAFLVYKHPRIGKRVIEICTLLYFIGYMAYLLNARGVTKGMNNSMEIIQDMSKQTDIFKSVFDNTRKSFLSDSIPDALKINKVISLDINLQVHKMVIMDSVINQIQNRRDITNKERENTGWYFFIGVVILLALYYLSHVLNKDRQPHSKKHDDRSD